MEYNEVTYPKHYVDNALTIEPIAVISTLPFCLGSALKYLFRYSSKGNPLQDLKKAQWYLRECLAQEEKGGVLRRRLSDEEFYMLRSLQYSTNPVLRQFGQKLTLVNYLPEVVKETLTIVGGMIEKEAQKER